MSLDAPSRCIIAVQMLAVLLIFIALAGESGLPSTLGVHEEILLPIQHQFRLVAFRWSGADDGRRLLPCSTRLSGSSCCTGVHSISVYHTSGVDSRREVHGHHAPRKVVFIVASQFGQHIAVCYIDVGNSAIRIHNLIHISVDLLLQIVVKVQGLYLGGVFEVFRQEMCLSEDFCG